MNNLDVWTLVVSHLTPREARFLLQTVKGLDANMCKPPALRDTYYSTRRVGLGAGADETLLADAQEIRRQYPQPVLARLKLRTLMYVDWVERDKETRKTTVTGVLVRFGQELVLFTYTFFVCEL